MKRSALLWAILAWCALCLPPEAAQAATIRWLGHACFLVTANNGTRVLMDPYNPAVGYPATPQGAEIATVSHEHFDHNNVAMAKGKPQVFRGLADGGKRWRLINARVKGIGVRSVGVYHDTSQGAKRGPNSVFVVTVDGVRIAHLGDLGHLLTAAQIAAIGPVDVLLVPVGGNYTIDGNQAAAVVAQLRPRIAIPMHYKTDATDPSVAIVNQETFMRAHKYPVRAGKTGVPALNLAAGKLPQATQVVVMDYRHPPVPAAAPIVVPPLSWSPEVRQGLDRVLAGPAGAATFDADGTIWADDVGEAFFRWLIAERKLKNVDYSKDLWAEYERRVKADKGKGYQWVVEIMAGLKELDVDRWAKDFFHKYFAARVYAPQKKLIAELKAKGFDVWIVSASNRWIVQAGAPYMGIAPNRVIGVDMEVENGVLTNRLKGHMTYAAGKVDAIKAHMAAPPVFACGDSGGDKAMMEYASGGALLIVHQTAPQGEMVELAKQKQWLLQYFPLQPAWQSQKR